MENIKMRKKQRGTKGVDGMALKLFLNIEEYHAARGLHAAVTAWPSTVVHRTAVQSHSIMDRDYRLLGLNYNRLLEQQQQQAEQSSSLQPDAGDEPPPPRAAPAVGIRLHDPRSWNNYTITSEEYDMSVCEELEVAAASALQVPTTLQMFTLQVPATLQMSTLQVPHIHSQHDASARKRKPSSFGSMSAHDGSSEDSRSVRTLPEYKKKTHNEVEKRRRDKMNTYISELSAMVPPASSCGGAGAGVGAGAGSGGGMARKLDKITVLKMAVKYLRGVRGASSGDPWTAKPPAKYLSERELNELVLQAARDAFLIVVSCDGGRLLYVSTSVNRILHYDQSELLGESIFELLHPNDIAMFKDQLSSADVSPQERFLEKEEGNVEVSCGGASRFCSGARRSFFCRIKCPGQQGGDYTSQSVKEDPDSRKRHKKYCVVQCTGYLKSWPSGEMSEMGVGGEDGEGGEEMEGCKLSCLVAVGRALADLVQPPQPFDLVQPPSDLVELPTPPPPPTRLVQYMSRHAIDGKFLFVDPRVTVALGYLPHDLVGTRLCEYVTETDMAVVAHTYRAALHKREKLLTPVYSFRKKDRSLALIQTHFKPFKNPWTKEEEHLVANNTIVEVEEPRASSTSPYGDVFKQEELASRTELQLPDEDVTDDVTDDPDDVSSHRSPVGLLLQQHVAGFNIRQISSVEANWSQVSDVPPSPLASICGGEVEGVWDAEGGDQLDGNDEAAMSIIMSLLEADAGLGGPVNLSGLPWPLP